MNTEATTRKRTKLDGIWSFSTPGRAPEPVRVPSSVICVGKSVFEKTFRYRLPRGRRLLLIFEGINYDGRVSLNGTYLGTTLPYCTYTFDVTGLMKDENTVRVEVDDINAPYGPTDGWLNYGGIIRSVYLDEVPYTYLSDVFFRYELNDDFSSAEVSVDTEITGGTFDIRCRLLSGGETVAAGGPRMTVERPRLWSPDDPFLYTLVTELVDGTETVDSVSMKVGFKSFTHDGRSFYLNGKKTFLLGVCRHDLGSLEEGQTLSDADIERDLVMIKQLGCNFVRLVHYPHDRRVVEACDRLGLMVSEESGLWWSDMNDPAISEGAVEVLRRTVLRDRSSVSVAFWMGFNECIFTQDFLNRSAAVCRALDPGRFVSGANCMCPEMTVPMFSEAGIDFYTYHPYGTDINSVTSGTMSKKGRSSKLDEIFDAFAGKPLVFTEWGGWNVVDNPALFGRFCEKMRQGMESGKLAGMIYWAFADMYELNRDPDADRDGIQIEGLVTIDRKPKACYNVLREFYHSIGDPKAEKRDVRILGDGSLENAITSPVRITGADGGAWASLLTEGSRMGGRFYHRKIRRAKKGPVLPERAVRVGSVDFEVPERPAVAGPEGSGISFDIGRKTGKIFILGGVSYSLAWPYDGEFGEKRGEMTLVYSDGTEDVRPLRNGIEILSVCTSFGSSFADPRSPVLVPAVSFSYDRNFENYRIYVLPAETDGSKELGSLSVAMDPGYSFLIYGISADAT